MSELKPRVGIVVWVYNLHQVRQLRRFGLIYYTSRKMKYVYLYVDQEAAAATQKAIAKLRFVRKVELSHRPELATEFGEKLAEKAKDEEQEPFFHPEVDTDQELEKEHKLDAHHIR
ncbi:MAG: YlbG family protein [Lactobacillus sp.]|jgi:uncharacterized protein YlbG (UPF0298 family)|nr:YlbG family protein [Lactobacillus sp.]